MLDMVRYARYLVNKPMAYRVSINNIQIEADTLAEVMELIKQIPSSQSPSILPDGKLLPFRIGTGWNQHSVARLLNLIGLQTKQLAVLYELNSAGVEGLLKEELVKTLGTSGQQLGGTLSGIAKNAKKLNLPPVFEIEHTHVGEGKTCRYSIRGDFAEAWAQLEMDMAAHARDSIRSVFKKSE